MATVTEEPEVEVESEPITGELIVDPPKEIPIKFNVSDAKIAELKTELTGLKIVDKKDYDRVVKGIAVCRTLRSSIEKCRKGLKEHALSYGRKVDAEATRLKEAIEAIEDPLKVEKEKVDEAAAKAKREAEEAKRKIVEERIKALVGFDCVPNPLLVAAWSDEQFETELQLAFDCYTDKKKAEAEAAALAAKAEADRQEQLRIEREKIEAERAELAKLRAAEEERQRLAEAQRKAELERIEAEQAAERARIAAEQAKIDEANRLERERIEAEQQAWQEKVDAENALRAEQDRLAREELEAAKREIQAEKDRIAREEWQRQENIRIERNAAEQSERERVEAERIAELQRIIEAARAENERKAAEAESERLEALKPDREKIVAFAEQLRALMLPQVLTDEAIMFVGQLGDTLLNMADRCEEFGE